MNHITNANKKKKGESAMVCEGILNLCGTSSKEIIERTKKEEAEYYLPKINQLTSRVDELSSRNTYLESLLKKNNIPFDLRAQS